MRVLSLALITAHLPGARANSTSTTRNVIVDDTDGSFDGRYKVIYSPADVWKAGSANGCDGCLVSGIDAIQVQNGTWHEAAYDAAHPQQITATILFEGTGISVYGLLPHTNSSATSNVIFHTALDTAQISGSVNVTGSRGPKRNSTATMDYGVLLVAYNGLNSSKAHNFTLVVGDLRDAQNSIQDMSSIFLLDYILITQDNSTSNSTIDTTGTSSAQARASNHPSTVAALAVALVFSAFTSLLGA
ncbi:hypothetical protein BN946_scf184601.g20 [Trametes cinnabarina]|uniref:Uncharacterized protein n=1 Tax=Pycnoporus cinnabarinus TaxID=5643 RepID=A0A060S6F2_PYCCI|nr:hypothetical protein BN946_scf184601.g20 [Trametes cinnabarina]